VKNSQPFLAIARWVKFEKLPTVLFEALVSLLRSGPQRCSSRVSDLALLQTCVFRARGLHLQIINHVSYHSPMRPDRREPDAALATGKS
jgi:hypothetical protein